MSAKELPEHYFRLELFRGLFNSGLPILLYHKMGRAEQGTVPRSQPRPGLMILERMFTNSEGYWPIALIVRLRVL